MDFQLLTHDDAITWKRLRHYWPFVRGIHQSTVDYPNKRLVSSRSNVSLTHWGRVTHICVSKLTDRRQAIIWTNTGPTFIKPGQLDPWIKDQIKITLLPTVSHLLLPNFVSCGRACPSHMTQNLVTVGAKLWTAERFLVDPWSMDYADPVPLGTNFSELLIEILTFSLKKMRLKVSSAKRRPFCLGLNVLMLAWTRRLTNVCDWRRHDAYVPSLWIRSYRPHVSLANWVILCDHRLHRCVRNGWPRLGLGHPLSGVITCRKSHRRVRQGRGDHP